MTETPSPHPYPPDTITQMTTVPILCKPVEQHRHSESCRVISKLCSLGELCISKMGSYQYNLCNPPFLTASLHIKYTF